MPKLYAHKDASGEHAVSLMMGRRIVITHGDYGVFFAWVTGWVDGTLTVDIEGPDVPTHVSEADTYDWEAAD